MLRIRFLISCGNEVETMRDIASSAIRILDQLFVDDLEFGISLREWDFRRDVPRVVDRDQVVERSLDMVRRSDAVIVILGEGLPPVTREEIREALSLVGSGDMKDVFVFLHRDQQTDEQREFVQQAAHAAGKDVIWAEYSNCLTFQELVMTTIVKFVLMQSVEASRNDD